jgi:hypothetical protein
VYGRGVFWEGGSNVLLLGALCAEVGLDVSCLEARGFMLLQGALWGGGAAAGAVCDALGWWTSSVVRCKGCSHAPCGRILIHAPYLLNFGLNVCAVLNNNSLTAHCSQMQRVSGSAMSQYRR